MRKYGNAAVWKLFTSVYEFLPLAAIIDRQKFCCHGGLSPDLDRVEEINEWKRAPDIPHDGGLCDLMWSDPNPEESSKSKLNLILEEWEVSPRGAGYYFGPPITEKFLKRNDLQKVIRAHQLCPMVGRYQKGYLNHHKDKCLTIFSAPNYCLRSGNKGAFLKIVSAYSPDT